MKLPSDILRHGARGADTRTLQTALNALGENIRVDGIFGDVTFHAVCDFQTARGLEPDGVVGPKTWAAIAAGLARLAYEQTQTPALLAPDDLEIDGSGVLSGPGVTVLLSHRSWYGGFLGTQNGTPEGVVCHVSDTGPGTSLAMARNRVSRFHPDKDRLASWHATVDTDGSIVQQVPFINRAWHAGSPTAKPILGLGWANSTTNGIELVGYPAGPFPEAQVVGYARLLRALRRRYSILREFAMIEHATIDPARRTDPGKEWMTQHAKRVLDAAYAPLVERAPETP